MKSALATVTHMSNTEQGVPPVEDRARRTAFIGRRWFWPLTIFLIALLIRLYFFLAFSEQWGVHAMPRKDAQTWDCLAMNILLGKGYVDYLLFFKYQSVQVPFYMVFLSFLYFYFGHSYLIVKLVQLLISALTCVFVFKAMDISLGHRKAALCSGILCALYLPYIRSTHVLMTETLFVFLFVASMYCVLASVRDGSVAKAALGGVLGGLATLTRAASGSLFPLFALWHLIAFWRQPRKALRFAAVSIASFTLVLSPWLLRSYLIHGAPLMATIGSLTLWTGSNPKYDGSYDNRPARREALWMKPGASEGERAMTLGRKAIDFVREDPYRYLAFCSRRHDGFWRITRPRLENLRLSLHDICRSLPSLIFPLAPLGMILALKRRKELFLLLGAVFLFSGAHGVFGATERYRIPLDWIFMGYAALFLCAVFGSRKKALADHLGGGLPIGEPAREPGSVPASSAPRRTAYLKKILMGALALMVAAYLGKMTYLYVLADRPHFGGYPTPAAGAIEKVLAQSGLLSLWEEQARQTPSVQEIFQRRVASGDYDSTYPRWIIVWTGEMRYILESEDGMISNFRLYVNAKGTHIGEAMFFCSPATEARGVRAAGFSERAVATVIGYTDGQILGAPYVRFVDILPYNPVRLTPGGET